MKLFFISTAAVAVFLCCAQAQAPLEDSYSLPRALNIARDNNPDIAAARQAWKVARNVVTPAKTWANPTFTYIDENFPSGAENMPAEKIKHYRLEQAIPFPGKLSGESRMKYHESLIAEANYRSKELDVLGDVRMRYYQLYLTDRQIELANESVDALRSVLQTAQSRLATGQSSASDVFMAQMELRKVENLLFQQQQARTLIEIELNTLLNQPTATHWAIAEAPVLIDLPVSIENFQLLARNNAPQYQAAKHETGHAQAMLGRNRLEFAPDFNFLYEREQAPVGPAGRQIGVGVSFPLWFERPLGLFKSSQEHVAETEAMSQATENMVLKMVHVEYTETTTHLTLSRNYEKDILPIAQSNLKIARDQYASGRGDFLRVLEALRSWLESNNEYEEQLYHYGEHWSLLERWVGVDLSQAEKILTEESNRTTETGHAH